MSRELGETSDPAQLVPGNPSSITATAQALRLRGDSLHEAGLFRSGNVKVIVNYDMPWRSISYYVGGK
jgi:hypothetical protein